MKVLLLATATNLPWVQAEAQRILRSGLSVVPLLGPTDYATLIDEIGRTDADLLWVCGHLGEQGIELGKERINADRLAPLCRRFRLIVLNTCSSQGLAQQLQNETDAEIIATIREIEDESAFGWGAIFAQALARTGSSALADEQARPGGNKTYIRLAGRAMDTQSGMSHDEYNQIMSELAELRRAVQGSRDYGWVGLTGQIGELRTENQALKTWLVILTVITLLELLMLVFIVSRYVFV